jgi:hypothetical protein
MEENNKKPDNDFGAMFSAIFSTLYKNVSVQGSSGQSAEINDNTTFGEMSDKMGDVIKTSVEAAAAEQQNEMTFDDMCDKIGEVTNNAVKNIDLSGISEKLGSVASTLGPDNDSSATDKTVTDETTFSSVPLESSDEPTPGNPSESEEKPKPKKDLSEIMEEIFGSNLEHGIGECIKKIAPQVTDYINDLSTKLKAREFFIEQLKTCTLSEAAEKTKQEFNLPENVEFDVNVTIKF